VPKRNARERLLDAVVETDDCCWQARRDMLECRRGHPRTPEHTVRKIGRDGYRCKTCKRDTEARRREAARKWFALVS
jgi:hypothetical protein